METGLVNYWEATEYKLGWQLLLQSHNLRRRSGPEVIAPFRNLGGDIDQCSIGLHILGMVDFLKTSSRGACVLLNSYRSLGCTLLCIDQTLNCVIY
jgi:hypothetical protein